MNQFSEEGIIKDQIRNLMEYHLQKLMLDGEELILKEDIENFPFLDNKPLKAIRLAFESEYVYEGDLLLCKSDRIKAGESTSGEVHGRLLSKARGMILRLASKTMRQLFAQLDECRTRFGYDCSNARLVTSMPGRHITWALPHTGKKYPLEGPGYAAMALAWRGAVAVHPKNVGGFLYGWEEPDIFAATNQKET